MAILRPKEIRKLDEKELGKRYNELKLEMAKERGNIRIGGTVTSPGRISEIRRTIARIKTINLEKSQVNLQKQSKPASKSGPEVKKQ